ncbi:MAG: hypothetical protein ABI867_01750 [Kofleriaceae bacterium]
MRLSLALLAGLLVPACDTSESATPPVAGNLKDGLATGAPVVAPPIVKKPLDTKPLPALEREPATTESAKRGAIAGTGTGKALRSLGFGGLGIDTPTGVAVAANGDIYLCGHFDGEIDAGPAGTIVATPPPPPDPKAKKKAEATTDAYLAKITPDGKLAWIQRWGGRRDDVARAVAVRGNTIVVVGNFTDQLVIGEAATEDNAKQNPAANSDDMYVAAFDPTGKSLWVYTAGGSDSDGANAVAAAPDGGWYVGGSFMRIASFDKARTEYKSKGGTDAVLLKLSKDGDLEWLKQFGGAYNDTILHLAVDAQGSVYAQGHFKDKSNWGGTDLIAAGGSDNDIVLAKYDLNGDHVWSKRFGNAFNDVAGGLTVDRAGNTTMVGSFDKSVSFGEGDEHISNGEADIFIARFDGNGKLDWAKTYGADREDVGWGVAADATGATVMTGWFQAKVDFGKTTLGPVESKGNKDVFALKHDVKGNLVWVQTWGDKDYDQGRAIALDPKGHAVVAGLYRFTMSIASPALESIRAADDRIPKPDTFVVWLDR